MRTGKRWGRMKTKISDLRKLATDLIHFKGPTIEKYKDPIILVASLVMAGLAIGIYLGFLIFSPRQNDERIVQDFIIELQGRCNGDVIPERIGEKRTIRAQHECHRLAAWAENRIWGRKKIP